MVAIWVRQQRQEAAPTTPRKYRKGTVVQRQATDPTRSPIVSAASSRPPSSRQLAWFVLRDPDTLTLPEQATLTELQQRCADVAAAYPLVHEFLRMMRQRDGGAYTGWRAAVTERQLPDLESYASGLDRDQAAVLAALTLPWSNGQTEGQVNRLKTLKRQMYGRANFDLLRKRVLHAA